ncbi:MAG: methylated-DNA--[protein]-cysteine S-methyltransferase [Candidatus Methylomirabilia bacterium]
MSPKPSRCLEIDVDLLAAATGEATPPVARRVQGHLDRCGPCREEFDRYQAVERAVADLQSEPVPDARVALARDRLESRLADLRSRLLTYRIFPSPLGNILIARSEQGVSLVEYLERRTTLGGSRLSRLVGLEAVEEGGGLETPFRELLEYLEGRRTRFEWPLDLRLIRSDFHRAVLQATAKIPYGAVVSYAGIAWEVGRPAAVRAAAQALRWNPLPIVVPCHRVVGASGSLTGYAGHRVGVKERLLATEGIPTRRVSRDFQIVREAMYVRYPGEEAYCLPSCPSLGSLTPARLTLFGSRGRAEAMGLAPCTTCRPDLNPISHEPACGVREDRRGSNAVMEGS